VLDKRTLNDNEERVSVANFMELEVNVYQRELSHGYTDEYSGNSTASSTSTNQTSIENGGGQKNNLPFANSAEETAAYSNIQGKSTHLRCIKFNVRETSWKLTGNKTLAHLRRNWLHELV
jgi:hypothetical protein